MNETRSLRAGVIAFGLLLPALTAALPADERAWLDADGRPLPFDEVDQVVEFLASAAVEDVEDLSTGITKPKKLLLEWKGVRAHAVFHSIHRREQRVKSLKNGRFVLHLLDSYRSQVAAFEMGRLLGLESVPPTVRRRADGRAGSVQLWIENAVTEQKRRDRALDPPDVVTWDQQKADQWIFDNLINNIDRNTGNSLIDASWNLWLIDHTRSFGPDRQLPYPERISYLSKGLWARLRALDPEEVRARLAPHLTKLEIKALLARHEMLLEAIEARIARLGEDRIVREAGKPWMAVVTTPAR